jgi:hypothetical protein
MANLVTGRGATTARESRNLFIDDNFQEDKSKKTTFNEFFIAKTISYKQFKFCP